MWVTLSLLVEIILQKYVKWHTYGAKGLFLPHTSNYISVNFYLNMLLFIYINLWNLPWSNEIEALILKFQYSTRTLNILSWYVKFTMYVNTDIFLIGKILQLFTFETVKKHLTPEPGMQPQIPIPASLIAGAVAGVSSTLATYPLELLKTRLTVQVTQALKIIKEPTTMSSSSIWIHFKIQIIS